MGRKRKKNDSPRVAARVAGAILGLAVGAGCAALWLALKGVAIVGAAPKLAEGERPARHEVYYISGDAGPVRQSLWNRKHRAFLQQDGNGIEVREQDLNWWSNVEFGRLDLTRKWEAMDSEFRIGLPQFRLAGNRLHVGLINKLTVLANWSHVLVIQAEGDFQKQDGRFAFAPRRLQIGSLPIPFGPLRAIVADFLLKTFSVSEDFSRSWAAVNDVQVSGAQMRLGFAPSSTGVAGQIPPAETAPPAATTPAAAPAGTATAGESPLPDVSAEPQDTPAPAAEAADAAARGGESAAPAVPADAPLQAGAQEEIASSPAP